MTLSVRDAGAVRATTEAKFRASDGLKFIEQMGIRTAIGAGGMAQFYQRGIRLGVNPLSVFGTSTSKTGPVYSGAASVSVSGGTAPYAYAWTATSGLTPINPSSASTAFQGTPPALEGEIFGTANCLVTDDNGLTSSISVDVQLTRSAS